MWKIIKRIAQWVVDGFRWLGRKICLIRPVAVADSSSSRLPAGLRETKEEKSFNLSGLPSDLITRCIAPKVDVPDLARLIRSSKRLNTLFLPQLSVPRFLRYVARGRQEQARAMLIEAQETPRLLLQLLTSKGTVTDDAGRTFHHLTAFQYALWALDRHMWEMILPFFDKMKLDKTAGAAAQLDELESKGTVHGKHYDFSPLIRGLQRYVNYLNGQHIDWTVADQMWRQGIGGPQRQLPAHVVNEYCREERPFAPLPANVFKENNLPRSQDFYNLLTHSVCSWFSSAVNAGLGFDFAIHGLGRRLGAYMMRRSRGFCLDDEWARWDLVAVSRLRAVRTEELAELKLQLLNPAPSFR